MFELPPPLRREQGGLIQGYGLITHFHILIWAPDDWDYGQIICSRSARDTDYPTTNAALEKLLHHCQRRKKYYNCYRVDPQGEPYCTKGYPQALHTHSEKCGPDCRLTQRLPGEQDMSEYIPKLFYLWSVSDQGCVLNCRVIRNTGSILGYTTKAQAYVCKPADKEVSLRPLISVARPYICTSCNRTFTQSTHQHALTCKNQHQYRCKKCGITWNTTAESVAMHLSKCMASESPAKRKNIITNLVRQARCRTLMASVFTLLGLPRYWCNATIGSVSTVPPWSARLSLARGRTLDKRAANMDPRNFNKTPLQHFLERPLSIDVQPSAVRSKNDNGILFVTEMIDYEYIFNLEYH